MCNCTLDEENDRKAGRIEFNTQIWNYGLSRPNCNNANFGFWKIRSKLNIDNYHRTLAGMQCKQFFFCSRLLFVIESHILYKM